jgi:hypothetical protein
MIEEIFQDFGTYQTDSCFIHLFGLAYNLVSLYLRESANRHSGIDECLVEIAYRELPDWDNQIH